MTPLAKLMFGWAFAPRSGSVALILLAGFGALFVADQAWRGPPAANLPFEDVLGFYAFVGFGGVAAMLCLAQLLRLIAPRAETPKPEGRDGDHA